VCVCVSSNIFEQHKHLFKYVLIFAFLNDFFAFLNDFIYVT
jgi:hypothetical protein